MRVNILKPAALAALMAMAACTNEISENPGRPNDLKLGQGEDVIRISLSNTTGTRAARPIGSSEAMNNVNRLAFKFLTSDQQMVDGIQIEGVIDEATSNPDIDYKTTEGNVLILPEGYDGSEICVKFSGLQQGAYKIIAYGYNYDERVDKQDAFPYTIENKGDRYLLQCKGVTEVQEIFAGCNTATELVPVNQHGKFGTVPEIELNRQVAGLMAYFENAPVFVNNKKVAKITVSSKARVTGFYFPALLASDPSYNGMQTADWAASEWVNYLTFDMMKASNYNSNLLESGDYYEFDNEDGRFLLATETNPIDNLVCNENTLFGSRFLLAYPMYNDFSINEPQCATLNICYWDEEDGLILSVPLRSGGNEEDKLGASSYQYGIKCNNFYSIGSKDALDGDPGNNDPLDIDEPTGYDYAKVSINNDWTQRHDLIN